jgi:3-methyladenine DNA glycosylase AlkD
MTWARSIQAPEAEGRVGISGCHGRGWLEYSAGAMDEMTDFVRERFTALSDVNKARDMAAYMKTDMPFYGVQKPQRVPVYREIKKRFPASSQREYARTVLALWQQPHREEKYVAIMYAQAFPQFIVPASMPLYKRLIIDGAWWDFVDEIATRLVGVVLLHHREAVQPTIDAWIDHKDMWLRRTAIICQLKHKEQTDVARLFDFCLRRAHEKEFFIRKAIGWALREYAYTDAKTVRTFLRRHRERLSVLSFREAGKHLELD